MPNQYRTPDLIHGKVLAALPWEGGCKTESVARADARKPIADRLPGMTTTCSSSSPEARSPSRSRGEFHASPRGAEGCLRPSLLAHQSPLANGDGRAGSGTGSCERQLDPAILRPARRRTVCRDRIGFAMTHGCHKTGV